MYKTARAMIENKYGSINKLSKIIGVEACDLYSAFAGTKPMYPKYRRLIAEALGTDERVVFCEEKYETR